MKLLTEHDVASLLSISLTTLRRRRTENGPPVFIKIGTSVRYRLEAIEAFLNSCPVGGNPAGDVAGNNVTHVRED